jgi:uridine kinase
MKITKTMQERLNQMEHCLNSFEELKSEMQETFDEKSEKWQESERGEIYQSQIDAIEAICDSLQEAIDNFNELENL